MRRGEENLGGQPHGVASRTRARSKAGAAKPEEAASSKREQAAARVKAAREAAAAAQRAAAAARREAQQTPSAAPRRPIDQASPHSALSEGVDSRALAAERQLQQHRDEEYWAGWAEEAAARGEQALQQDMEDACVGQLRALLGGIDDMPPGDAKLLLVMQVVGPLWLPEASEVAEVSGGRAALARLLDLSQAGKLSAGEGTPLARRAGIRYILSCSS